MDICTNDNQHQDRHVVDKVRNNDAGRVEAAKIWALMDAAIQSNNLGVSLLCERRLEGALLCFKSAARMMHPVSQFLHHKRMVQSSLNASETADAPREDNLSTPTSWPDVLSDETFHASLLSGYNAEDGEAKDTNQRPASPQHPQCPQAIVASPPVAAVPAAYYTESAMIADSSFVVCEPIVIDRLSQYRTEPTSCTTEASAIVFNMGLVYRLFGSTESLLMRSWSLFDMAFSLLSSIGPEARNSKIGLACLNNAGEAQYAIGNYRLSHQYLDTLYATILSLPPATDDDTFRGRHQLLLNVMLLREPSVAAAA